MTNYNLKAVIPPSLLAQQKKAERKKLLEEVRKRRDQIAKARGEKEQNVYQQDEEYREYQEAIAKSE